MTNAIKANLIHPEAIKAARKHQGMSQQQLAEALKCTKDTVSRWERGANRRVRPHLQERLEKVLHTRWEKLTTPPEQTTDKPEEHAGHRWVKWQARKDIRTALQLVALRYNVSPWRVLELAPLLFLIVAERSLLERRRRLDEIKAIYDEMATRVSENRAPAYLGWILATHNGAADGHLEEEEKSLAARDVFGRLLKFEDLHHHPDDDQENPFVHFLHDFANGIPEDALAHITSFDSLIYSYQIADDTLREYTGISEDEEHGKDLLRSIRKGWIDLADCLRARKERNETSYRQWLLDALLRVKEEHPEFSLKVQL